MIIYAHPQCRGGPTRLRISYDIDWLELPKPKVGRVSITGEWEVGGFGEADLKKDSDTVSRFGLRIRVKVNLADIPTAVCNLHSGDPGISRIRPVVSQASSQLILRIMGKLEPNIGKAGEILTSAETKFNETVNPLRWRLDEIKSDIQQMWNLSQQLVEPYPYPELIERAGQIVQMKREAHEEATALRRRIEKHLIAVREYESQDEKSTHRPHQQKYRERVKLRCAQATETEGKLKQTLKRIDDLD
jgi:hypothetical protein